MFNKYRFNCGDEYEFYVLQFEYANVEENLNRIKAIVQKIDKEKEDALDEIVLCKFTQPFYIVDIEIGDTEPKIYKFGTETLVIATRGFYLSREDINYSLEFCLEECYDHLIFTVDRSSSIMDWEREGFGEYIEPVE